MNPQQRLFRKAALDKMASPERLDEMMEVTAPAGWLALVALGVALAGAVLWSIFGSIAIKVHGRGILLRGEAVLAVTASSSGTLVEIVPSSGDEVGKGDVVARVGQPDLVQQIEDTRAELETLLGQDGVQTAADQNILAQLATQRRDLEAKITTQEDLLRRELVTRGTVLNTRSQLSQVEQSIAQRKAAQAARRNRIDAVQRTLRTQQRQLTSSGEIRSPYSGRVLELALDPGNLVRPGDRLLTLEALEGPIDAVVYIPAADGKKVQEAMARMEKEKKRLEARISPSTVKTEEYGYIIGEVKKASVYPVTPGGMERVLRNPQMVQELTGEGAKIAVTAGLLADPATESGFRWSSSTGPPSVIYTGTVCTASVVVEKKRPISYVLPIFKKTLGTS